MPSDTKTYQEETYIDNTIRLRGVFQFHIIASISTSYNRKLRYCPTALQCG